MLGLLPRCRCQTRRRPPLPSLRDCVNQHCVLLRAVKSALTMLAWACMGIRLHPNGTAGVRRYERLLNLGFFESNVLARDRIVFAKADFIGRRTGVLLGHIEEPSSRSAQELDLL